MLVTSVEIETFRNITNKQTMVVDPEVTCLIGKNESGKTTVLKALHRLNPANNAEDFHVTTDYLRRNLARDRRTKDLDTAAPVTAVFELEDADFDAIEELVGVRPPAKAYVKASRLYDCSLQAEVYCALEDVLADVFEEAGVDGEEDRKAIVGDHTTIEAVSAAAKARAREVGGGKKTARGKAIEKVPDELDRYKKYVEEGLDEEEHEQLIELLPKFFYFSTCEMLPGECDLHALAERAKTGQWQRGDETMMSLLRLAGEGPDDSLDEDYASRKAELQAASLDLSAQVFQYWKRNEDLTVVFDTDLMPTRPGPRDTQTAPGAPRQGRLGSDRCPPSCPLRHSCGRAKAVSWSETRLSPRKGALSMAREADRSQDSEHRHQHTATRAPLPASEALHIQRTAGNSALIQLLRQAGHPWAQEQHQHTAGCGHQQNTQAEQPSVQRSAVHDVLRTSGHPLDDATRTDMEARLGADFSDVRVHDDSAARASAAEVGARAYTSGSHVVIGEGGADEHTLAHELTHVIQQRKGPVAGTDTGDGLKVSDPSDRYEREAEANATRVMSSAAPTHTRLTRDSPTLRAAGAVGEPAAVQRLFAADPGRGNVGEDLATAEPLVLADTASAQGEHVFNAFNALAVELADRLEREAPPSSALNTAIATLRQQAARLGGLRDNAQFRAAPAGQGNSANATSYSQYIQQIRAAMTDVLAGDPTGGWSRLVGLSHTILDRAMDQDAWNYQNSHQPRRAFERWSKDTKDAMTDTFSALLSAVSAARAPQ